MDNKKEFAARLTSAMKAAGYIPKPSVLEREFNLRYWGNSITLQGVRRWLKGEAIPSEDKLEVLAEWLRVDKRYLRFGVNTESKSKLSRSSMFANLTNEEIMVFKNYLSLDAKKRKVVAEVIEALLET